MGKKLNKYYIKDPVLNVIYKMYLHAKSCVKYETTVSCFFNINLKKYYLFTSYIQNSIQFGGTG